MKIKTFMFNDYCIEPEYVLENYPFLVFRDHTGKDTLLQFEETLEFFPYSNIYELLEDKFDLFKLIFIKITSYEQTDHHLILIKTVSNSIPISVFSLSVRIHKRIEDISINHNWNSKIRLNKIINMTSGLMPQNIYEHFRDTTIYNILEELVFFVTPSISLLQEEYSRAYIEMAPIELILISKIEGFYKNVPNT